MYTTVNSFYTFANEFNACGRGDQFSTDALRILFDYLEQYQEDTGESIELDVVALCCDYSEMTWKEVVEYYSVDLSDLEGDDDEERIDAVRDYLEYSTQLCGGFTDGNGDVVFVFQAF